MGDPQCRLVKHKVGGLDESIQQRVVSYVAVDQLHSPGCRAMIQVFTAAAHQVINDDHTRHTRREEFVNNMGSDESSPSGYQDIFSNQLHGRHALPVFTVDERLSSVAAEAELAEAGRKGWRERKAVLDAAAARILLQTFLDTRRHERP